MSCKYFILTKPNNKDISHNNENQIVFLNNSKTYILPQVNIEYYMKQINGYSNMFLASV